MPELWNAGVAALLALAAAAALAYVAARIALRPLARIEHVLDRIITGDATELPPLEDRELAAVESKLSLVGAQVTGARRDASQMRSAMSSIARGVAHEFKNPLNAIALRLELLRARVAEEAPEAENDIDILTQEVARLDRVVKTFLDLNRPVTLEREMLQAAIDRSQVFVTGRVRLKLYKGSATLVGRESPYSLYDQELVTFEEGAVAYDHRDAEGFIKLNALRLRTLAKRAARGAGK